MTLPFMAGLNYKPKTSLTGSRTSHLDACPSMEHAHPSYARHSTPDVTHKLGQVRAKFYAQIVNQCIVFSLWTETTNWLPNFQFQLANLYVSSRWQAAETWLQETNMPSLCADPLKGTLCTVIQSKDFESKTIHVIISKTNKSYSRRSRKARKIGFANS
jgi:hypothetical protein